MGKEILSVGILLFGMTPFGWRFSGTLTGVLMLPLMYRFLRRFFGGERVPFLGTVLLAAGFMHYTQTRIATISAGYGDGYPRALSNKGTTVLIRGKRCPILGRICMDQFMADVTDVPEAALGDKVTLIGTDGEETITAEELGDISGKFNYELVCGLDKRIPRVYKKGGKEVFARDYFLEEKDLFEKQDD